MQAMATGSSEDHHCSVCKLTFPFKYRLERHLKSTDHLKFEESQKILEQQENDQEFCALLLTGGVATVEEVSLTIDSGIV